MGEKSGKKEFRFQINRLVLAILLYNFIVLGFVIADVYYRMLLTMLFTIREDARTADFAMEKLQEELQNSGWSSIFGVIIGIVFLAMLFYKYHPEKAIFRREKRMKGTDFLLYLCVFMGGQFVFSILAVIMETILNTFGLTLFGAVESASAGSTTISMFLYSALVAPIGEEIVYRGFVLRYLQRYGRWFAIFVSAVLFGVMHGNLIQGVFAFFLGIVLGYVAVEYSIKWSICLHFINNCLFGEVLSFCMDYMPQIVRNLISFLVNVGFFVAAVIILICKRKKIINYIRRNVTPKELYFHTFTAIWMIVFCVLEIGEGIMGIESM